MTIEDYNKMLEEQNGVCALCKEPDQHSLHVDHNHDTGKVRGLLCSRCNIALGCFKEDPNILRNATEYLKSWDT